MMTWLRIPGKISKFLSIDKSSEDVGGSKLKASSKLMEIKHADTGRHVYLQKYLPQIFVRARK